MSTQKSKISAAMKKWAWSGNIFFSVIPQGETWRGARLRFACQVSVPRFAGLTRNFIYCGKAAEWVK